jgi:hypothetical protein
MFGFNFLGRTTAAAAFWGETRRGRAEEKQGRREETRNTNRKRTRAFVQISSLFTELPGA